MNGIFINGRQIFSSGGSISVMNGKVTIDGEDVDLGQFKEKVINIVVEGNVNSITSSSADITVNGNSGSISTSSGDIKAKGDVSGSITTMSGDVSVKGKVEGNVSTMSGDISRG
jgi:hypothetical protein